MSKTVTKTRQLKGGMVTEENFTRWLTATGVLKGEKHDR